MPSILDHPILIPLHPVIEIVKHHPPPAFLRNKRFFFKSPLHQIRQRRKTQHYLMLFGQLQHFLETQHRRRVNTCHQPEIEQEVTRLLALRVFNPCPELFKQRIGRPKKDESLQLEHIQPVPFTCQQVTIQARAFNRTLVIGP